VLHDDMKIYVKQLYDEKGNKIPITLPQKGTEVAAGYDIVATSDPKIVGEQANETVGKDAVWKRIDYIEYETNLFIAPSAMTFHTLIHPRSSVSKYNLVLANSIGLVDNDYRGMVICRFKYIWQPEDFSMEYQKVALSDGGDNYTYTSTGKLLGTPNMEKVYKKGDKIAQLVLEQTVMAEWELVEDLSITQRGAGGFGSTDKKEGKPLVEVFAEEQKKFESKQNQDGPDILKTYLKSGGVPTQLPYSERMKQTRQE